MAGSSSVGSKLAGKRVYCHGKFEWGAGPAALVRTFGGVVAKKLEKGVDIVVLPDLLGHKGVQKQVTGLNGGGATIRVMDYDDFAKMVEPTAAEVAEMIRLNEGALLAGALEALPYGKEMKIQSEDFGGRTLTRFEFDNVVFRDCSFADAKLEGTNFGEVVNCDFSRARTRKVNEMHGTGAFEVATGCSFVEAGLERVSFGDAISGSDFTGAKLDQASYWGFEEKKGRAPRFAKASLKKMDFNEAELAGASFQQADVREAKMAGCDFRKCSFAGANLEGTDLSSAKLQDADFSEANLKGAKLCAADLRGADFSGADMEGCKLRGAQLSGAKLEKARNLPADATKEKKAGPALKALDAAGAKTKGVYFTIKVDLGKKVDDDVLGISLTAIKRGWGLDLPDGCGPELHDKSRKTMSRALLEAASLIQRPLRFETLTIQAKGSRIPRKELEDAILAALEEAFEQKRPEEAALKQATQKVKAAAQKKAQVERAKREKARAAAEKRATEKREKAIAAVTKKVGSVTDLASFHKALAVRADGAKLEKATSMLKASGFQLFNDVTPEELTGVVKSQTDPDLVYACRIGSDGKYGCCTQNLNICGGLRGSPCKHLLVLMIGLVQAGALDPAKVDGWMAKTHGGKPELDREKMGEVFIKYKGAEAGEVDWRPTETLPEDYYAV